MKNDQPIRGSHEGNSVFHQNNLPLPIFPAPSLPAWPQGGAAQAKDAGRSNNLGSGAVLLLGFWQFLLRLLPLHHLGKGFIKNNSCSSSRIKSCPSSAMAQSGAVNWAFQIGHKTAV